VLTQFYSRPEIALRIPPGAFRPPPKVASALVAMRLPGEGASLGVRDEGRFLRFVQQCFAQKRKTITNNLRVAFTAKEAGAALEAAGIRAKARAEELTLEKFASLFRELKG
jgi:16S rRNA (adenine1518-N6/adenine1519-N6)-dimethyltransferase